MKSRFVVLVLVFLQTFLLFPVATLRAESSPRLSLNESFTPMFQQPAKPVMFAEVEAPNGAALKKNEILIEQNRPFSLKTRPALEKPWYKKWWVWTIAVAVAGGIVAASADSDGNDSAGAQTGTVKITGGAPSAP